ncbi:MAG: hypothetical protein AB4041_00255 [Microcystaceae cyanobacterium]
MRLGKILIRKKRINSHQLDLMLKLQQTQCQRLGEILVNSQMLTRQELDDLLKEQYWRRNGYWVIN